MGPINVRVIFDSINLETAGKIPITAWVTFFYLLLRQYSIRGAYWGQGVYQF